MTANQLKLAELREKQRSNVAQEELTASRDRETARANRAQESVNWFTAQNVDKYNMAMVDNRNRSLDETVRSNKKKEKQTDFTNLLKSIDTTVSLPSKVLGIHSLFG